VQTHTDQQRVIIQDIATGPRGITIDWDDGHVSEFHFSWLRDNCRCSACWHPQAQERLFDALAITSELIPSAVRNDSEGTLIIDWDGHESIYDPTWLRQHCYSASERARRLVAPTLWNSTLAANPPKVSYESIMSGDAGLANWLKLISEYGFALMHGGPAMPGEIANVVQKIANLRATNYEPVYDVQSKPDPNSIAYTAVELKPHNDLTNRFASGVIQFLYCIESTATGGDSILVDGFSAAHEFRRRDADGFSLLTSTPLDFRFQDQTTDIQNKAPIIALDLEGNIFQIRYNHALLGPLDVASELVEPIYAAYRTFTHIVRDPDFQLNLRLDPGDMMAFNNLRVLHGRGSFNPQSGRRHLQGCYVDIEDFQSRLKVLQRQTTS
jgi:gamma-butyrobetaine dioxygenase